MAAYSNVSTQTSHHTITIVEGNLTIAGDGETLTPDEMLQLLDALLIWQYGLEAVPLEDLEG
jgi:hypothetical protein